MFANNTQIERPIIGYDNQTLQPVYGDPVVIDGLRLQDARGSYGISLRTFALGFPIHFDWSWRTLFNKDYENAVFAYPALVDGVQGPEAGSTWFRRSKFSVWIGYDF